ncbi:hypothetical protein [Caldithrix abyssi]|nr:hypothetical protein [Caldithrix abyssi]
MMTGKKKSSKKNAKRNGQLNSKTKLNSPPEPLKSGSQTRIPPEVRRILAEASDTADLIDQPEFDGFYLNPIDMILKAMEADKVVRKRAKKKKHIEDRVAAEILTLIEYLSESFLTDRFIDDLFIRVYDLNERAEMENDSELICKTDAILELLELDSMDSYIIHCGLYQSIIMRSYDLGRRILEMVVENVQKNGVALDDPADLVEHIAINGDKLLRLEDEFPGLTEYLINEIPENPDLDFMVSLLLSGTLFLDIFFEEDLEEGYRIVKNMLQNKLGLAIADGGIFEALSELSEEQMDDLYMAVEKHLAPLISDELIEEMYNSFEYLLDKIDPEDRTSEEVYEALEYIVEEFDFLSEDAITLLIVSAFLGELDIYIQSKNNNNFPDNILKL